MLNDGCCQENLRPKQCLSVGPETVYTDQVQHEVSMDRVQNFSARGVSTEQQPVGCFNHSTAACTKMYGTPMQLVIKDLKSDSLYNGQSM